MANSLNVALVESIRSLFAQGWSRRRIARELGVDRATVGKYVSEQSCGAKPANLPTGSEAPKPASLAGLPAPPSADREIGSLAEFDPPKPASNLPTGSGGPAGPASKCEPFRVLRPVENGSGGYCGTSGTTHGAGLSDQSLTRSHSLSASSAVPLK